MAWIYPFDEVMQLTLILCSLAVHKDVDRTLLYLLCSWHWIEGGKAEKKQRGAGLPFTMHVQVLTLPAHVLFYLVCSSSYAHILSAAPLIAESGFLISRV